MKISAVLPLADTGRNANVAAWSTTETAGLFCRVAASTPRVRMELASHDIAMAAQAMKPRRSHRRSADGRRVVIPTASAIDDSRGPTDTFQLQRLRHIRAVERSELPPRVP